MISRRNIESSRSVFCICVVGPQVAEELNQRMDELLHGETRWLEAAPAPAAMKESEPVILGSLAEEGEQVLAELNAWMKAQGLPEGIRG